MFLRANIFVLSKEKEEIIHNYQTYSSICTEINNC